MGWTVTDRGHPVNLRRVWRFQVDQLLTLRKAAMKLDVSLQFLKRLQRQGRLRVIRLGRAVRVSELELERLVRDEFRK
jgi:excisionase family DNA binding protein